MLVFNLTNNIDVDNTKQRMDQYQRENRDIIQRNKAKLVSTDCIIIMFIKGLYSRSITCWSTDSRTGRAGGAAAAGATGQ